MSKVNEYINSIDKELIDYNDIEMLNLLRIIRTNTYPNRLYYGVCSDISLYCLWYLNTKLNYSKDKLLIIALKNHVVIKINNSYFDVCTDCRKDFYDEDLVVLIDYDSTAKETNSYKFKTVYTLEEELDMQPKCILDMYEKLSNNTLTFNAESYRQYYLDVIYKGE